MVGQGPYGVYVTKFHWLLDTLCLIDGGSRPLWSVRYEVSLECTLRSFIGVYVTKFHWLLDTLCLMVDQDPYGVYVTKFHWLLDTLCLMKIAHAGFL